VAFHIYFPFLFTFYSTHAAAAVSFFLCLSLAAWAHLNGVLGSAAFVVLFARRRGVLLVSLSFLGPGKLEMRDSGMWMDGHGGSEGKGKALSIYACRSDDGEVETWLSESEMNEIG
jgi:hypothetical protein